MYDKRAGVEQTISIPPDERIEMIPFENSARNTMGTRYGDLAYNTRLFRNIVSRILSNVMNYFLNHVPSRFCRVLSN